MEAIRGIVEGLALPELERGPSRLREPARAMLALTLARSGAGYDHILAGVRSAYLLASVYAELPQYFPESWRDYKLLAGSLLGSLSPSRRCVVLAKLAETAARTGATPRPFLVAASRSAGVCSRSARARLALALAECGYSEKALSLVKGSSSLAVELVLRAPRDETILAAARRAVSVVRDSRKRLVLISRLLVAGVSLGYDPEVVAESLATVLLREKGVDGMYLSLLIARNLAEAGLQHYAYERVAPILENAPPLSWLPLELAELYLVDAYHYIGLSKAIELSSTAGESKGFLLASLLDYITSSRAGAGHASHS